MVGGVGVLWGIMWGRVGGGGNWGLVADVIGTYVYIKLWSDSWYVGDDSVCIVYGSLLHKM